MCATRNDIVQQLERAENLRREISPRIAQNRKAEFGQFMTPSGIARFMASLFPQNTMSNCRLLDAGAGIGALSCAFLDRWTKGGFDFDSIDVFAYEIDESLRTHLCQNLSAYNGVRSHVFGGDFIELSDQPLLSDHTEYTHEPNPPYKKIGSDSDHRRALRNLGVETVNLYSAFVALAVAKASPNGQIVAIIPRSFCNGPYYKPFRNFILSHGPFGTCICLSPEIKRSGTTTCYRKTSSFALSAEPSKAPSPYPLLWTTGLPTLSHMSTHSIELCMRTTPNGSSMSPQLRVNPSLSSLQRSAHLSRKSASRCQQDQWSTSGCESTCEITRNQAPFPCFTQETLQAADGVAEAGSEKTQRHMQE